LKQRVDLKVKYTEILGGPSNEPSPVSNRAPWRKKNVSAIACRKVEIFDRADPKGGRVAVAV
jgi:hypothetical protein